MEIKKAPLITVITIFDYLKNIETKADNPFEVDEVNEPFNAFCEKYLPEDIGMYNEGWASLCDLIRASEENAFKIGFDAAKSLLM